MKLIVEAKLPCDCKASHLVTTDINFMGELESITVKCRGCNASARFPTETIELEVKEPT